MFKKSIFVIMGLFLLLTTLTSCKKTYTVEFDVDGGSIVNSIDIKKGKTISKPNDPIKEGYEFLYWEYNNKEYDFNTKITSNIVLKAKWNKLHEHEYLEQFIDATCTEEGYAIYTCECGHRYTEDYIEPYGHKYLEEQIESTCKEKGYTKYSCKCGETYNDNYTEIVDHVYDQGYCKWCNFKEIIYKTISFDVDGGTNVDSLTQEVGTNVLKPTDPIKEGYVFDGWYLNEVKYEFTTMPSEDITLVAKWIKLYTVTVYLNNGEDTLVYQVKENSTLEQLQELDTPYYEGYEFIDFYYDDAYKVAMKPRVKITKDIELYAKWDKIYYITYDLNGGTIDVELRSEFTATDLEYSNIELKHPIKEGYYFRGWYDNSSFEGDLIYKISKGDEKDFILYAKFVEAKLENAYVSVIGDSISAFEGILPSGFTHCYCYTKNNGCLTLNDMWWKITQKTLGFKLGIINAYAGTTVMKKYGPQWATENMSRIRKSLPANKIGPDIMILYIGGNDAVVDGLNISEFETSYRNMINNVYELFPNIQIFVSTLCWEKYYAGKDTYEAHLETRKGVNDTIRKLGKEYNLPVIEFAEAFDKDTADFDTLYDTMHPSAFGMKLMSEKAIEAFKQFYGIE